MRGFHLDAGRVFVDQLSDIRGWRKPRGGWATLEAMWFPAGLDDSDHAKSRSASRVRSAPASDMFGRAMAAGGRAPVR
ncbi:hypothetical protein XcvCFBP7112P_07980 [Xanthomonas citri pv. vignicola]|nr:hypothetical protein XcvCFBP7112P_07980 [Xanthomonas citri pv. vignicola]